LYHVTVSFPPMVPLVGLVEETAWLSSGRCWRWKDVTLAAGRYVQMEGSASSVPLHYAGYLACLLNDFSFDNLIWCLSRAVYAMEGQFVAGGQHLDGIAFLEFSF